MYLSTSFQILLKVGRFSPLLKRKQKENQQKKEKEKGRHDLYTAEARF